MRAERLCRQDLVHERVSSRAKLLQYLLYRRYKQNRVHSSRLIVLSRFHGFEQKKSPFVFAGFDPVGSDLLHEARAQFQ